MKYTIKSADADVTGIDDGTRYGKSIDFMNGLPSYRLVSGL